ncbi:MAG: helix-turn-helix domain-containing protein [Gaiellaceae bacterium]
MLTVPEAARRANRNPETIRRWIRAGKLRSRKIGTQHIIEEQDLDAILVDDYEMLPLPDAWKVEPHINVVRIIRQAHESR